MSTKQKVKQGETMDRATLIQKIYEGFKKPIPAKAIQSKDFGNKTNGYIMGYLIELINDTLIPLGCSWDFHVIPFEHENGNKTMFIRDRYEDSREAICVQLRVNIYDPEGNVLMTKDSFGGIQFVNKSLGDSLKGAQTDALKKAFSYFGLGNKAFCGAINEQLLQYNYAYDSYVEEIQEKMPKLYARDRLSKEMILKVCRAICKKSFDALEDLEIEDLEFVVSTINAKLADTQIEKQTIAEDEQGAKDGKKGRTRKNTPKPVEEEMDNSFEEHEDSPF